jgi:hypothetical protein
VNPGSRDNGLAVSCQRVHAGDAQDSLGQQLTLAWQRTVPDWQKAEAQVLSAVIPKGASGEFAHWVFGEKRVVVGPCGLATATAFAKGRPAEVALRLCKAASGGCTFPNLGQQKLAWVVGEGVWRWWARKKGEGGSPCSSMLPSFAR